MPIPDYIDNKQYHLETVLKEIIEKEKQIELDIATGFFRIEAWLRLEDPMKQLDSLRLLIGRDPTIRAAEKDTFDLRQYFRDRLREQVDEKPFQRQYKDQIDRVIAYLKQGHIQVRLYGATNNEFLHAKAYIFNRYSIVGSSNFTPSGIRHNKELNIVNKVEAIARDLRANWFEDFWNDPSVDPDYKTKLIAALDASKFGSKAYTPYQVFLKALYELFQDDTLVIAGDRTTLELASFQQEGFERAIRLMEKHYGCMVADAVGLGKTYIGLRVIEYYLLKLRRSGHIPRAIVCCPAQLRDLIWKKKLAEFGLPYTEVISHEEMGRNDFNRKKYHNYDLLVIDESHNFRNSATNRYQTLAKLLSSGRHKRVLLLTATPINNNIFDLYHQISLLTRGNDRYYQEWDIPNLQTLFKRIHKGDAEITDLHFQTMVRRSRLDVIKRQQAGERIEIAGREIKFPKRKLEQFTYNFEESFSGLYAGIAEEISNLNLAPYNIKAFQKQQKKTDEAVVKRNQALVALQKALYLKRLESSLVAFKNSITNQARFQERFYQILTEENKLLDSHNFRKYLINSQFADDDETTLIEVLDRLEPIQSKHYNLPELTRQIEADIKALQGILAKLQKIQDSVKQGQDSDRKLVAFKDVLLTLTGQKVLVFSYFKDTTKYIYQELQQDGQWQQQMNHPVIDIITGESSRQQRETKVKRFAPKANAETEGEREALAHDEIEILICTDVLSEGQNLQDAGVLINYDLHWNPVRMIQRAGRIDRLGTEYENLSIYNCFPEEGLERLLGLVARLQQRIADIDRNVGLDASVLGEEISERSLEELLKLKQASSEAEKQAILAELEQLSDLVSLDEMRFPLTEFMQRVGREQVQEIPMGIHSRRQLQIDHPDCRAGGIFLAFRAEDRHYWHFYPRVEENGSITTDPDKMIIDKRRIFSWLQCQESDFPAPETLPPARFDKSIFRIVEGATRNIIQSSKETATRQRFRPRQSKTLLEIKTFLNEPSTIEALQPEETETKERILSLIADSSEISSYDKEIKRLWKQNKRDGNTLIQELNELFIDNELYREIDPIGTQSILKVLTAENIQLVCYEWFDSF
ncbi:MULTISPECIES: helicase-related protein [Spirulina sp. CCY15215]|uniref:helicase-related protein n=1 Tax=Spirulina sp. CCY15215 TaxID=2767591 RepID=UPI001950965C|nr:helicase-related protein [Spirulina major]